MGCFSSKALPTIDIFGTKKSAAAEACKSFDNSKEEITKEFEEKKTELQPKVLEIYEAAPSELKVVVKERTEEVLKKNSAEVTKFLDELVKIEFPGSKQVSEASTKYGTALVSEQIFFVFEKVAMFVPTEPAETTNKEVVIEEGEAGKEEEKKEEEVTAASAAAAEDKEAPKAWWWVLRENLVDLAIYLFIFFS